MNSLIETTRAISKLQTLEAMRRDHANDPAYQDYCDRHEREELGCAVDDCDQFGTVRFADRPGQMWCGGHAEAVLDELIGTTAEAA